MQSSGLVVKTYVLGAGGRKFEKSNQGSALMQPVGEPLASQKWSPYAQLPGA